MSGMQEQALKRSCQMLYAALRRHRRTTITGWAVTAAGCLGIVWSWDPASPHGLFGIGMSAVAIVAGILLVQESVGFLTAVVAYVQNEPLPADGDAATQELHTRLTEISREIDSGGWQEAFAALGQVRSLARSHLIELPG